MVMDDGDPITPIAIPETVLAPLVRPGYKTTEFWVSSAAVVVGALAGSGLFRAESTTLRVLGLVAAVLSALGYTVARTVAKR